MVPAEAPSASQRPWSLRRPLQHLGVHGPCGGPFRISSILHALAIFAAAAGAADGVTFVLHALAISPSVICVFLVPAEDSSPSVISSVFHALAIFAAAAGAADGVTCVLHASAIVAYVSGVFISLADPLT